MPHSGSGHAEQQVAAYFAAQGAGILNLSLSEIAADCGVSEPTVVRYCRRAGYAGLKDYKIALARQTPAIEPITGEERLAEVKRTVFAGCVESVQSSAATLSDEALARAVALFASADNIDVYATGGSAPVASYLRHQLLKLGIRTNICSDRTSMMLSQSGLSASDVVLAISCTGVTASVAEALASARARGAATLCITNVSDSAVAKSADVVLSTSGGTFLGSNAFARLAQMAVVDALFAGLVLARKQG